MQGLQARAEPRPPIHLRRLAHGRRACTRIRALLEVPFERVIISHCDEDPVHTRAEFERALGLPPSKDYQPGQASSRFGLAGGGKP